MAKLCDICGDSGVVGAILTCIVCKISREHAYCIRGYRGNGYVPSIWTCEACEVDTPPGVNSSIKLHAKESLGPSKFTINPVQGRFEWEKRVNTGKTKYLPTVEAIRLSSGTKQLEPPRTKFTPSNPLRYKESAMSRRPPLKPNAVPQKFSPPRAKTNPASGSSGHLKPPRQQQETSHASKELKGPAAASKEQKENNARKEHVNIEQPLKAIGKPVEDIGAVNINVRKEMDKVSGSSSVSLPHTPKAVSGDIVPINEKPGDVVAEGGKLMNISPQVVKNLPTDPAVHPSWKGSFKLPNCKTLNSRLQHEKVHAYPPSKVLRKVYEFSKKMPQVLEFILLPCQDIWKHLFFGDIPDSFDIGLYFFPSNDDGNENFVSLMNFLVDGNIVMKSCVNLNGVELFVFPSVFLHIDSQEWNGLSFLWGVFRHVKTADVGNKESRELPPLSLPSILADGSAEADDNMEIDMVGGTYVGKQDIVISRQPNIISPTAQSSLFVAEKEMCALVPPGFENYKRIYGSQEARSGRSNLGVRKVKYLDSCLKNSLVVTDHTSASLVPKSDTNALGLSGSSDVISSNLAVVPLRGNCGVGEDTHLKIKTEVL